MLCAGGRWDHIEERWTDQEPESAHEIRIHPGQVPFFQAFGAWLEDFREGHERGKPREVLDRLWLAESGRRAGKTRALQTAINLGALDMPRIQGRPLVAWIVSKSHEEEEEIRDNHPSILPGDWWEWKERLHRYQLIHGSYVALLSSDRPATTKRGKVDLALVNEAQKQRLSTLTNLIYGVADSGGLAMLAANPHDSVTGEWVAKLRERLKEGKYVRARSFYFDPRLNHFIDQLARSDVDDLVRDLAPKQADRDGGGIWLPLVDKAYHAWSDSIHLRPAPQLGDVTNQVLRAQLGVCSYRYIAGVDFQARPGCCAVIAKLYGDPNDPLVAVVDEVVVERGSEFRLSDELAAKGYRTDDLLLIADASGLYQDYSHEKSQDSFTKLKSRGWEVLAPQKKRSNKGKAPANPKVPQRLTLVNDELTRAMFQVDPTAAPVLATCMKECILKPGRYETRVPSGDGWLPHMTDAAGYLLWWLRPTPEQKVEPLPAPAADLPPAKRAGTDWWS